MKYFLNVASLIFLICINTMDTNAQAFQWAQKAGGSGNDYATCIDIDANNNSYIAGRFFSSISFGATTLSSANVWSVYIAKYDAAGVLAWAKIVASATSATSNVYVNGIIIERSGLIGIAGRFYDSVHVGNVNAANLISTGDYDAFIAQFDNSGNLQWARSAGGIGIDYVGGVSTDNKGHLFMTGDFHASGFPNSASKVFIAKYDSVGAQIWLKTTSAYGTVHVSIGIKTDTIGNSYITGQFFNAITFDSIIILNTTSPEANVFVAKIDAAGNPIWMSQAGAASGYAGGLAIDIDKMNNSYVTGFFKGTILFGALSITGQATNAYDAFVAKFDPLGNFIWVKNTNGHGANNMGNGISVDDAGNSYITGFFSGTTDFGSLSLTNIGAKDCYVAKLDPTGDFVWVKQCEGQHDQNATGIKANTQSVFITGNFLGALTLGGISLVADTSFYDVFVTKISASTDINGRSNYPGKVTVYPTPCFNTIYLGGISNKVRFKIYDVAGKILLSGSADSKTEILVSSLASGVYFIRVTSTGEEALQSTLPFVKD